MLAPLRWLGRLATRAAAAVIFLGIAVPPLGEGLRPYVGVAVFALLVISFIRVDISALVRHMRSPGNVIAATVWTSIAIPFLAGGISEFIGIGSVLPGNAIILQSASVPMMAALAIAALL